MENLPCNLERSVVSNETERRYMRRIALSALLLCAASAQAFDGEMNFLTAEKGGLTHTLVLSEWKKDSRGVPSFDYVYEQRAGTCLFRLAGHAIADFVEEGGVLTFDVFNSQDEHGKEVPPILSYYGGGVSFSLPEKGPVREVGLAHKLKPDELASFCGNKDTKKLHVAFKRR